MITMQKVRIYRRYNGDIDGLARIGTKEEKEIMTDHDWNKIDGFILDIRLVKKGLAGSERRTPG